MDNKEFEAFKDDIAEGFYHANPENVIKLVREDAGRLSPEQREELSGMIFVGLKGYYKFKIDGNGTVKYECRDEESIEREFRGNHGYGWMDSADTIKAMQESDDLTDFERFRLERLIAKEKAREIRESIK